ncbi:MAG: hypothetical protein N4A35_05340 [Flavobacteriales bacterium]|jgi:hypothetical protein|nr:hypothetical protein [Flavobacteriales bacterium]
MSEYSKEYIEATGLSMKPDFSFRREFKKLKEGYTKGIICEGFGTKAIGKFNGELSVLLMDNEETTLDKLINNYLNRS